MKKVYLLVTRYRILKYLDSKIIEICFFFEESRQISLHTLLEILNLDTFTILTFEILKQLLLLYFIFKRMDTFSMKLLQILFRDIIFRNY